MMAKITEGMILYSTIILLYIFITGTAATQAGDSSTPSPPSWCSEATRFYCYNSDECKPAYMKCDGTAQCEGGEDELNCISCTADNAESMGKYFCPTSGKCIHIDYRCDGMVDCEDADDDEKDCEAQTCTDVQFPCGDGQCIGQTWACDNQVDCTNGKDEEECEPTCAPGTYACKTNQTETAAQQPECINAGWKCDAEADCPLGDDEDNCQARECENGRFLCTQNNKCLPATWRCDGDDDCETGEDEAECDTVSKAPANTNLCTAFEFKCATGHIACIIGAWKCDGEGDCTDGSDEKGCEPSKLVCSDTEFECKADKSCIPSFLTCSGKDECTDGADEKLDRCTKNVTIHCNLSEGKFACGGRPEKCITLDQVCDGSKDCQSNNDEDGENGNPFCSANPPSDPCDEPNICGSDKHIKCINIKTSNQNRTIGHVCRCPSGYSHIGGMCADNDECQNTESPVCDHLCTNEVGGYRCECNPGYLLEQDGRSCRVTLAVHPKLIFTNMYEIRSVHIHGRKDYMPLIDSTAAVALDFDYVRNEVFYSDVKQQKIYKFKIPEMDSEDEPEGIDLGIEGVKTPDGLAYDWVYRHLYWTDTSANTINMACVDDNPKTRQSVVLFENKMPNCTNQTSGVGNGVLCIDEPRAIAVHPRKGWVFWSDWGYEPHIALGAMDGSRMEKIAYNTDNNHNYLLWPNGLTLDISSKNERLYWIDARLHSLFTCTIDRCVSDISVLLYDTKHIKHPYSITVFENKLYWSDWSHKHIASANKYTGGNITKMLTNIEQPMDLKVFHPASQVQSTNYCENAECDQMCVPKPWSRTNIGLPFSIVPNDQEQHTCLCMSGFKLDADGKGCSALTTPVALLPPKMNHTAETNDTASAQPHVKKIAVAASGLSVGVVAAIAASCILGIAVVIAAVVFIVHRRIRQNKSKSMNFDNPIYKRTTEDKLELPRHEYQPSRSDPAAMVPLTSSEGASSSTQDDLDV